MRQRSRLLTAVALLATLGCSDSDPNATGGPIAMRRLTAEQFAQAMQDSIVPSAGAATPEA